MLLFYIPLNGEQDNLCSQYDESVEAWYHDEQRVAYGGLQLLSYGYFLLQTWNTARSCNSSLLD